MDGVITVAMGEAEIFGSDRECGRWTGSLDVGYTLIPCSTVISGRYVQIQLKSLTYLTFYEIEVHGY